MGEFYLSCLISIFGFLGLIARLTGFRIFRFIVYIQPELFPVLGTSSSESALAPLMEKLEPLGCPKAVVGLVVPSKVLFLARALGIDMSFEQQLTLVGVAMLTSKGASGVTGAGFVALAHTLAIVPSVPVARLALILGHRREWRRDDRCFALGRRT